ncbi:MAG: ATP-binding protein [Pyrinomonadaceae bacterium]
MEIVDKTVILIVQAMQMAVVLLIIVFAYTSTIAKEVKQESFQFWGSIRGEIDKTRPLLFIALGFLCNLIYLILNMIRAYEVKDIPASKISDPYFLIFLFNILTTYCFLLQSLPQLYISNDKNVNIKSSASIGKKESSGKALKYIIVTLFTIIVYVYFTLYGENLLFYSFEFVGCLLVSWHLFQLTSIHNDSLKDSYTRYLIFTGWMIWTSLQLWKPVGSGLGIPHDIIQLTGFSLSLLAKCLILFGLYDFSVRIGRRAIKDLTAKVEQLNILPKLVNSVSNSKDLKELSTKVVRHLTNKEVFDFDYAIFSEVNHLKQRIIYAASKIENNNIKQTEKWVWSDGITFDHHDIMAEVFRKGETIHAYREQLDERIININSEKSPLNREIYNTYNHQNLNRLFIPVKNLKDSDKNQNRVVAIIEVGYCVKGNGLNSDDLKIKDKIDRKGELNLYLDNCAQSYERLIDKDLEEKIASLLKNCDNLSKDDPIMYLQEILKSTCILVDAEFCFIALVPLDKNSQNSTLVFEDNETKDKEKIIENFLNCIEGDAVSGDDVKINESKFKQKMYELLGAKSMQVSEICFHEVKVGYLFMLSRNKYLFNEVVNSIIQKIADNIGATYNEKKFHNAVASLVSPDNAIIDLEANIQPLIEMIKSYFGTPYISIWLKDDKDYYVQKYASDELRLGCTNFGVNKIHMAEIELENEYKIIQINSNNAEIKYTPFKKFGRNNNLKTLLLQPLKTQHQSFGLINIYFKNSKNRIVYEDINFLNLISVKALITIQIHDLVRAFREISDSFTQNDLNSTLQTITNSAVNLLNADPVILYKSNDGVNVYCSDVTFSYKADFKEEELLKLIKSERKSHVHLAENIIKSGSRFFSNKNEYKDYIQKHSVSHNKIKFKDDFWDRENIKSLAAVKLVHKTASYIKPVGVLFINFRNEVTFNDEIIKVIETFAAFASGSISNGLVFKQNRQFLLDNLRLTKPLLTEALTAGALHDAKKIFDTTYFSYNRLVEKINDPYDFNNKKMNKITIRGELEKLKSFFVRLDDEFYKIEALYAPAQNTVIENHDVKKILQQQLDIMEAELFQKNIKVTKDFPNEEIFIDCDESQIGLAILNILKNAYQAMGNRGELEVRVKKVDNSQVKIEIVDNGKGISDDIKAIMFNPNITNKEGGTGLGLSMSKYVIENNHLGHIKGRTKDGKTTFTIILPIKLPSEPNIQDKEK